MKKIVLLLMLCMNVQAVVAEKITVTEGNLSQFSVLDSSKRLACYEQSQFVSKLGILNSKSIAVGKIFKTLSKTNLKKQIKKLKRKRENNEDRYDSFTKKIKRKKKLLKLYNRHQSVCGSSGSFLGNANSLAPYRDNLTDAEINHILGKVAFGGNTKLKKIAKQQGLNALVNALVNGAMTQEESEALESNINAITTELRKDPEAENLWFVEAVQFAQFYRAMQSGNPFHEWMFFLLNHHFATNLGVIEVNAEVGVDHAIPQHWNLLKRHAVGNFYDLANGFFTDHAMNRWLDNMNNTVDAPNQNYARELLELFVLGAVDPVKQTPNYDEETIIAATAYASGYAEVSEDPEEEDSKLKIRYLSGRHDGRSYTLSRGIQGAEFTGNMQPRQFLKHVMFKHPGSSRYITERIAGQMLYVGLPESIVAPAARILLKNNFNLKPFLKAVLRSEAMFSRKARGACIDSPIQHTISLAKRIINKDLSVDSKRNMNATLDTLAMLYEESSYQGQSLFQPPSVFGWKGSCNINRAGALARGESWANAQRILARKQACLNIASHAAYSNPNLLKQIGIKRRQMNNKEIVSQVAYGVFDKTLDANSTLILQSFLDQSSAEREDFVELVLPRLICLIDGLPKFNIH